MKTLLPLSQFVIVLIFTAASSLSAQTSVSLRSGEQLSRLSRYGQSIKQLEAFIRENPNRLYDQSEAWLIISYNRMQLGDFRGALEANERSLDIKAQLQADDLVQNYIRFGEIHLRRGHYPTALENLLKAQELPIESIQLFAEIEQLLAAVYRGLGQYDQAESYYRQATETLLIEYPDQHPKVINSFYQLGELYLEWGRLQEAQRYFQQGLQRGASFAEQRFLAGRLYDGLGRTHEQMGNGLAEQRYQQAIQIFLQTFGAYHRETAQSYLRLARWYAENQRMGDARTAVLQALRSLLPDAGSTIGWQDMPSDLRIVIDHPLLIEALGLRARLLLTSATDAERRLVLDHAARLAELADETLHRFADHAERFEILATVKRAIEPGIRAGIELADAASVEKAFLLSDRWRLLDTRMYISRPSISYNEFTRLVYELRQALALAEAELRRQPNDLSARQTVQRQWQNYQYGHDRWRQADPYSYQWEFGPMKKQVADIRALMDDRTAIISYWFGEEQAYVFGLGRSDIVVIALPQSADAAASLELSTAVETYRNAIAEGDELVFAQLGIGLYQQFIAPLDAWLEDKEALVILPDGPLRALPFETLLTEPVRTNRSLRYHKLPYLLRDHAVSYHLAAQMIKREPKATSAELALFSVPSTVVAVQQPTSVSSNDEPAPLDLITQAFERKGGQVNTWTGDKATSEILIDILQQSAYVHLATVVNADSNAPEQSVIRTSSGDPDQQEALSISTCLAKGPFSTSLLTYAVPIQATEPVPGDLLARPIVGSTWLSGISSAIYTVAFPTASKPQNDIFPNFYQALAGGASVQQAWNDARRELIDSKATADPRYWARWIMVSWP